MVRISRIVNAGRRIARVFVVGLTSLALVGLPLAAPAADTAPSKEAAATEAAPKAAAKPKVLTSKELSDQQRQVAEKFKRFEQVIKLLAQFSDEADQDQARLVRQVFAESQSRALDGKFEELIKMLQEKRLGQAVGDQEQLNGQLQQLLTMLLAAERDKELKNEQARVKDFIKQIKQMINKQMELEGRTAEADPKSVAPDQGALSDAAAELAKKMAGGKEPPKDGKAPKSGDGKPDEGKPNEGKPNEGKPGDPKSGEPKEGEGKPGEPKEGKPGVPKSDKPKDGDSKPGEKKPNEAKPSEGKPSEGKPSEGKPSEGKPSEGKPSEGKPSEGKPSEGKPSQGKPSQGKPSEGQPQEGESGEQDQQKQSGEKSPMDSPQKRVAAAQQRMAEARKKLEEAKRDNAMKDQEEAIRELEQAKAELEEILRQLREEELARTLEQLERRFTEMLRMQEAVNRDTLGLHNIPVASRGKGEEIESGRLSREEGLILVEADKALAILKEDGTAVAFPRTVEQMRDDIAQVVDLLAETKVDDLTIAVENDIVLALKELIEALQKAKKDLKDKKQQQQQQQQGGEQQQPLIDQIAELKMIRSLQLRVNRRTKLISDTADVSTDSSALDMLRKLSITESDVYRITRDIVLGKNK